MGAGHPYLIQSAPSLTITASGCTRELTGREAALVVVLLHALPTIGVYQLGEVRLAFSEHTVDAKVTITVRRPP